MKKEDYVIKDIYQGSYSTFGAPESLSPVSYPSHVSSFGLTTDPRSANILKEVSNKLSTGVKQIEVEGVSPEIFESIPNQHLKEVNRLSKLTGIDVSLHAPIIEPSGIGRGGFAESERQAVERQMSMAVERAHELNPDGNIPVTFHSSAVLPGEIGEKGQPKDKLFVIDKERGSVGAIPFKKGEFPGDEEKDIEQEIKNLNQRTWDQEKRGMSYYVDFGKRAIDEYENLAKLAEAEKISGKPITEAEKRAISNYQTGVSYIEDSYRQLKELFEMAKRHGSEQDRDTLNDFANSIKGKIEEIKKAEQTKDTFTQVRISREIIEEGQEVFRKIKPQFLEPLNNFAKQKTTDTFANVAWDAYEKFKDKAPIISIENPPAGQYAFATGEELKDIIEKTREKFIEKAIKEGLSREEARNHAEKLIGATWDVGHINMLRKYGYDEKDIIEQSKKIKPLVKHIHLSDNFGFEHTELPMGMGNVPIKEIFEKLGKQGYESKKIIEAASWWQHMQTAPVQETLEAFGSPIYSMKMSPYWNQSLGFQQDYSPGMGMVLPDINYQTFGAGFSQLPTELGGQRQGQGARMSGRPME